MRAHLNCMLYALCYVQYLLFSLNWINLISNSPCLGSKTLFLFNLVVDGDPALAWWLNNFVKSSVCKKVCGMLFGWSPKIHQCRHAFQFALYQDICNSICCYGAILLASRCSGSCPSALPDSDNNKPSDDVIHRQIPANKQALGSQNPASAAQCEPALRARIPSILTTDCWYALRNSTPTLYFSFAYTVQVCSVLMMVQV